VLLLARSKCTVETYVEKKEEEGQQGPRVGNRTGVDDKQVGLESRKHAKEAGRNEAREVRGKQRERQKGRGGFTYEQFVTTFLPL